MKRTIRLQDGRSLYVRDFALSPQGKTVLFVHGGPGGNSRDFERFLETNEVARSSGINWVVCDRYGCGRREKAHLPYSHGTNVDDLNELVEALPVVMGRKVDALYGHSYGARLVYETCYAHPQILRRPMPSSKSLRCP